VIGVVIEEDQNGRQLKVINKKGVTDINLPRKRIRRLARLLGFDDLILDARDLAQRVSDKLGPVPSNMTHDRHKNIVHITYEIDLNKVGEHAHEQST
jgi:hypothetical protein